jgi:hypothetical protein
MSLATSLLNQLKNKVPPNVLTQCQEKDACVVENIMLISQQCIPALDLASSSLRRDNDIYSVSIPLAPCNVSLTELRQIQDYSPARILNIVIEISKDGKYVLRLCIADEKHPVHVTEVEIQRVVKRRRWFWGGRGGEQ